MRAGPELADFVHDVLCRLRDAHSVGDKVHAWCSWAGWTVKVLVEERGADARERAATERFVQEARREKEEARRGFSEFLKAIGVGSLREYISQMAMADQS